jgi:hypothetical protein
VSRKHPPNKQVANTVRIGNVARQASLTVNQHNFQSTGNERHIVYGVSDQNPMHHSDKQVEAQGTLGLASAAASAIGLLIASLADWIAVLSQLGFYRYLVPLSVAFAFAFVAFSYRTQIQMVLLKVLSQEERYIGRGWFAARQASGGYIRYKLTAPCNEPRCSGLVELRAAPPRETGNHDLVGICNQGGRRHTYTVDINGIGFPQQFDWRPVAQAAD